MVALFRDHVVESVRIDRKRRKKQMKDMVPDSDTMPLLQMPGPEKAKVHLKKGSQVWQ